MYQKQWALLRMEIHNQGPNPMPNQINFTLLHKSEATLLKK